MEFAEEVTGISQATLKQVAEMIAAADGVAVCWAMGAFSTATVPIPQRPFQICC